MKKVGEFLTDGPLEKVANLVDRFVTTKEERVQFEKELMQILIDAESSAQENVTDRWESDMVSQSWLSQNVRPIVLLFLVASTVLLVFIDAGKIQFEVKQNWVDLLQVVLITVITAYFGGRSIEKVSISNPRQERRRDRRRERRKKE